MKIALASDHAGYNYKEKIKAFLLQRGHDVKDFVRIQNSKFLNNAGPGIEIAGKRGAVAKVELSRNMFKGNRPILVENAPEVLASAICGNRQVTSEKASSEGLNAFADPIDIVVHQNDCEDGSDMRFEVNRQTRKKK
jgi:ribose 5-phosphate isomerase B